MQKNDDIEELVSGDMNEGEVVLWTGKPSGVKLLEMPYGSSIIIRWIVCLVAIIFVLWYGFIYAPAADNLSTNANVIVLLVIVIALAVSLWPLMDMLKLKGKCYYIITNQRALTLIGGSSRKLKEKLYSDISEITYKSIAENRGDIFVGKKLSNSFRKARIYVITPPNEEDKNKPLVFHSVINPEKVVALFPPLK